MNRVYFWKVDDTGRTPPIRVGELRVTDDDDVVLVSASEPVIGQILAQLKGATTLALHSENRNAAGDYLLSVLDVGPGDPEYYFAVSDAIRQKTGFAVTYKPEPPALY